MSSYLLLNEVFSNRILSVISEIARENVYLFTAKNPAGRVLIDSDAIKGSFRDQNIGVGKKITSAIPMIVNRPYVLNTVYDMYDDMRDETTVNNYVITKEGSNYYCYRCLDDNNDVRSTEQPLYATVLGNSNAVFRTADGYSWKFLFSATQNDFDLYGSTSLFPLMKYTTNPIVDTGKLDIVAVENVGLGYGNYVQGTFGAADLRINGDRTMFAIANSAASGINGYYTGCSLYVSSGLGIGEWRIITDYISNANGNYVFLDSNLDTVQNGSTFEVFPRVKIKNNGAEANVRARAIINSAGNTVQRVEILTSASNLFNMTATVVANDAVGVLVSAAVRPINSPYGGHGHDLINELRAKHVGLSLSLANTENATIPGNNNYQIVGLIKNPVFANVALNITNTISSFVVGETISKVTYTKVGVGSINTTSNSLVFSQFTSTDNLIGRRLLLSMANSFASAKALTLNSWTNSTAVALSSNSSFACSTADVYLLTLAANAVFTTYNGATQLIVSALDKPVVTGDILLGMTTGAFATVNNAIIADVPKAFSTFVGLQKYRLSTISGSFIANEIITNGTANSHFDSYLNDGTYKYVYTFNSSTIFAVGDTISGAQSLAIGTIDKVYSPEILPGSGQVLYMENIDNIQRANTTELFKFYI